MGAFGCKMGAAGCKNGSVGATPSFRFAICCFAHVCPVSGFRTWWGVSSVESLKPERAANRGLCGQSNNARTLLPVSLVNIVKVRILLFRVCCAILSSVSSEGKTF